ncbi:MAG TPA: ABC transporter permease [Vicinamibacterales bacterium]|jgi:phospholipid/cholesterol/gamma-HCH transport system permease protein|nr:ABC transporter permease [Vicinamibacterales bacterium]
MVVAVVKSTPSVLRRRSVESLGTVGRFGLLLVAVVGYVARDVARGRFPLSEFMFRVRHLYGVTAVPAILTSIPFGAVVSVQVGALVQQIGAGSLVGAASGMGIIRQGAPLAASLLLAGAAGSALAADFGSRAIREELDAMRVMGIDPVERLVAPAFLALLLVGPALLLIAVVVAVCASFAFAVGVSGISAGGYWQSFGAFASLTDLVFALLKVVTAAIIVAVVAGQRGCEATGGPRGVADAVNRAVVVSVVGIIVSTLVITEIQTALFPVQIG